MASRSKTTKSSAERQALIKGLRRVKKQLPLAGFQGDPAKWGKAKQTRIFNKYKALATGKAKTIKLSKRMAERYDAAGLKTVQVNGRTAIVSNKSGYDKIALEHGNPLLEGMIKHVRALASGEIEHIVLPYKLNRISDFIEECKTHPEWNKLKKESEKFRFGFGDGSIDGSNWNGNRWGSLADIADYLEGYEQVKRAMNNPGGSVDTGLMDALVIIRTRGTSEILENRIGEQKRLKAERAKERNKAKARRARERKQRRG